MRAAKMPALVESFRLRFAPRVQLGTVSMKKYTLACGFHVMGTKAM